MEMVLNRVPAVSWSKDEEWVGALQTWRPCVGEWSETLRWMFSFELPMWQEVVLEVHIHDPPAASVQMDTRERHAD